MPFNSPTGLKVTDEVVAVWILTSGFEIGDELIGFGPERTRNLVTLELVKTQGSRTNFVTRPMFTALIAASTIHRFLGSDARRVKTAGDALETRGGAAGRQKCIYVLNPDMRRGPDKFAYGARFFVHSLAQAGCYGRLLKTHGVTAIC